MTDEQLRDLLGSAAERTGPITVPAIEVIERAARPTWRHRFGLHREEMVVDNEIQFDDVAVAPLESDAPRRTRGGRMAMAFVGIMALGGVGTMAVTAGRGGGGGASSPEAAVQQLAEAIDNEDMLAAIDVIAPEEVRSLDDTFEGAAKKSAEVGLVRDAGKPFDGLDLSVRDLALDSETMAAGFSKVTIRTGTLDAKWDRSKFSDVLARNVGDEVGHGSADLTRVGDRPFLVAVQRDGGWYVSAAYTVMEQMRESNNGPAPLLGASANVAQTGADSPEAAVREAAQAMAAGDWERAFTLVPPGELGALYDYRTTLFSGDPNPESGFAIDELTTQSEVDGDTAIVSVSGTGTTENGTWDLSHGCLTIDEGEGEGSGKVALCANDDSRSLGLLGLPFVGAMRGYSYGTNAAAAEPTGPELRVHAVQHDGRWYVSLVPSVLDIVDNWVDKVDNRTVLSMLGQAQYLEPEAMITLNEPVSVVGDELFEHVYTFEGRKDQRIVLGLERDSEQACCVSGLVYDANREEVNNGYIHMGSAMKLPADGTYTIVVSFGGFDGSEFTLWDARDAPKEVLDGSFADETPFGDETCVENPDGSTECFATSSTAPVPGESTSTTSAVTGSTSEPSTTPPTTVAAP